MEAGDSNLPPQNPNALPADKLQKNENGTPAKTCPQDKVSPDLQQVISAWPNLSEHIKTEIMALIGEREV